LGYCQNLPFGDEFSCTENVSQLQFAGQLFNSETNNTHFWARDYSMQGRFTTPDPQDAHSSAMNPIHQVNPQRWNMYAYAMDSPVTYNDPTGMDAAAINFAYDVGSLGHEGLLNVFSDGTATYQSFGPASKGVDDVFGAISTGNVQTWTNPDLPIIRFGADRLPTAESLAQLKQALAAIDSKNSRVTTDPGSIRINYFKTSDMDSSVLDIWMKSQQLASDFGLLKYRLWGSLGDNCATYTTKGLAQARVFSPDAQKSLSVTPDELYWELLMQPRYYATHTISW
jgi:RHS repeat-associated protein